MTKNRRHPMRIAEGEGWLVSFSDLTLLLLFFLMFSVGKADVRRQASVEGKAAPVRQESKALGALVSPIQVLPPIFAGRPAERGAADPKRAPVRPQAEPYEDSLAQSEPSRETAIAAKAPRRASGEIATIALARRSAPSPRVPPDQQMGAGDAAVSRPDEMASQAAGVELPAISGLRHRKDRPPELIITLLDTVGFATGKAELAPQALPLLRQVHAFAVEHPELAIEISGHTDNVPIHSPRFASNWELASARALAVAHFFLAQGGIEPCKISARGFGEHRPVASNLSAEGRAENRRVEIRFYRGEGDCPSGGLTG